MTEQVKFDFNAFNALTNNVAPGLQIALAEGLLKQATLKLMQFDNPLSTELMGVGTTLKEFKVKYKANQEARKAAREAAVTVS